MFLFSLVMISSAFILVCSEKCANRIPCYKEDPIQAYIGLVKNRCSKDNGSLMEYWVYNETSSKKLDSVSEINITKPIKILVHGFGADKDALFVVIIKDAYLRRYKSEHTIIALNFPSYCKNDDFLSALCNSSAVSIGFGRFLYNLSRHGVDPSSIHIIGLSYGAHIAGMGASQFQELSNLSIGRITGLDPSGLGFRCKRCTNYRLDESDATFVDIIHTNLVVGTDLECGHIDFYLNNVYYQPGCLDAIDLKLVNSSAIMFVLNLNRCSHLRAIFVFAESILYNNFVASSCWLNPDSKKSCVSEDVIYMGEYAQPYAMYRTYGLYTSDSAPFGLQQRGPLA